MNALVVAIFALLCLVAVAEGTVKCYSCTAHEKKCEDPFTKSSIPTLSCDSCMKSKITSGNFKGKVFRSCAPVKVEKEQCEKGSAAGVEAEVCVCTHDLCNGAKLQSPSIILSTVLSFVVLVWWKM